MHPNVILTGGILHTVDPNSPRATALAIAGDSIMAVGDDAAVEYLAGPSTRRIDLSGRTVVPPFNDSRLSRHSYLVV